MTIEQINALTVEDVLEILISRLYPDGWVAPEPAEGEEPAEHPPIEELEAELEIYKAELIAEEEARLAELARIQDLNDRYSVFADFGLLQSALSISNPAAYFRDEILKNADKEQAETNIAAMESAYTTAKEAQDIQVAAQNLLETRRQKRLHGEYVLDAFTAQLEASEMSNENSMAIMTAYAPIINALKLGSLEIAKAEALVVEPTEILSQELIDAFVALIDEGL